MRPRVTVPVLATAIALGLAGCGGGGDDAPSSGGATSGGKEIDGTGYKTSVPTGWKDAKEVAPAAQRSAIDTLYASVVDKTLKENLIVTREAAGQLKGQDVDDLEAQVRAQAAKAVGAATPALGSNTTYGGDQARQWTIRRTEGTRPIVQRQVLVLHADTAYTITLTTPQTDDQGAKLLEGVRTSWSWE